MLTSHPDNRAANPNVHRCQSECTRALQSAPYCEMRNVRCEYVRGVVILYGFVPSYYCKQMAQTLVRSIDGVEGVYNRIQVLRKSE